MINDCKQKKTAAKAEMIINDTPPRIRLFDSEGEAVFRSEIDKDVEDMYPSNEDLTLKQHIECASGLAQYLADFVPEVQKTGFRAARYDVLAVMLEVINQGMTARMRPVLNTNHPFICDAPKLGDIHAIIKFLTTYQTQMAQTICPVRVPGSATPPTYCELLDRIPALCQRYVNGDAHGRGTVGAAALLVDSCHNTLSELLKKPVDQIQQHRDGSFYTNAPTQIWSILHQHLELAVVTNSPILQVMVADKISIALKHIVGMITDFIKSLDTNTVQELKDNELPLLSALANDNAMHIEEIMTVVETITMGEIRNRVNEIFDDVTVSLVNGGGVCLKRLTKVVMSDIEEQLQAVFTFDWIEGNQLHVAVATIGDYLNDLQTFLMPFWGNKLVALLLEAITIRYTRSVIFRGEERPKRPKPVVEEKLVTVTEIVKSSFFGFGKKVVQQVVQQVVTNPVEDYEVTWCVADEECLGRIAQDINVLNAFFSTRVGQEKAQDYLAVLNEVQLMLQLPLDKLTTHALSRISEYPSSAEVRNIIACILYVIFIALRMCRQFTTPLLHVLMPKQKMIMTKMNFLK